MSIVFCCPTRGKPEYLNDFLAQTIDKSRLPDITFVVGIDADEEEKYAKSELRKHKQVVWSVEPREDSLGAKFNRCVKAAPGADWYIMGVDDLGLQTIAWDVYVSQLAEHYDDGVGIVNFGRQWNEPGLPAFQMSSAKFIELQGWFMAPFFPFWWHDTWNVEMGQLIGRNMYIDIEVRYPKQEPMTPRRDIEKWALFFDLTRPLRVNKARQMMEKMNIPGWRKYELIQMVPQWIAERENVNSRCRDPLWGLKFQAERVTDDVDERHQRLQEQAQAILLRMEQEEKKVEDVPEAKAA
jgi:hypothetical protein